MDYSYPEQWLDGVSKGEMIAAEIRLRIVDGTITPDTLLTENQIAKEFNVSRSPVRDAFK
ncbi:GntR family transcriptional regulator, partial [Mammaliicoccus sciuri]